MLTFEIKPFEGALPIAFGMSRLPVRQILGEPSVVRRDSDTWGAPIGIDVGYDASGLVDHIGFNINFRSRAFGIVCDGRAVRDPVEQADPDPTLLSFDPQPLARVGFLDFTRLGVATTGFHEGDDSQALVCYRKGAKDGFLLEASKFDAQRYHPGSSSANR